MISPARWAYRTWLRQWCQARLARNDAVIIDTETTDMGGRLIEISAVDMTGVALFTSRVAAPEPIHPDASSVHGLTDADLVDAPWFAEIAGPLLAAVQGRRLLAYNASYDRGILLAECQAAGLDPGPLQRRWVCVMRARARAAGTRWVKLGGPHTALGDCLATLQVVHDLAGSSAEPGSPAGEIAQATDRVVDTGRRPAAPLGVTRRV